MYLVVAVDFMTTSVVSVVRRHRLCRLCRPSLSSLLPIAFS